MKKIEQAKIRRRGATAHWSEAMLLLTAIAMLLAAAGGALAQSAAPEVEPPAAAPTAPEPSAEPDAAPSVDAAPDEAELGAGAPAGGPSAPRAPDEVFFNAESWRAFVEGKTLYYTLPGGLVGREYYVPGGNRVLFEYAATKTCFDGTWREENGVFCFEYDGTHCFYHLRKNGEVIARELNGSDQLVTKITVEPFSCSEDLIS